MGTLTTRFSTIQDPDEKHKFLLNMGPQHPCTHGVLRIILEMDGEHAMGIDPILGYGHRMHEKMAECRPWSGHRGPHKCAREERHWNTSGVYKKRGNWISTTMSA